MTATATAPTPETPYTPREAAQVAASGCLCAAAMTLAVIEEYQLTLYPPRVAGGKWAAHYHDSNLWGRGATAVEAVGGILRQIGENNAS
jgi:hypothetical protein